jgi:nitrate/nitrite transport system ATP-binding protein
MAILELNNVSKSYGARQVLKGLNLAVEEGEFLAILGFSGTGKTTLINLLAGLVLPDQGMVSFRGKPVTGPWPERGLVFQSYALMPWLTVAWPRPNARRW